MRYDWLPFLIAFGILLGVFHGYMISTPEAMNVIGAAITGAAIIEFVVRVVEDIREDRKLSKFLGLV